ncbi:NUDIX hydrolase [Yinghuangia sp. KLBMP8922]|uniref:NUDIX hydrolase n=2 Tax=Yinghuangia soli TaxID=2908204 RepID=A0AA41PYJ6_9ACTN|nr:NUDIX hydrolase [Yinghuangia soli]
MDVLLTGKIPAGYDVSTAVAVALDSGGRTLLTRVARPGRGWDVPGGHVEPGETPDRTAARELAEETGLSVPPTDLTLFGGLRITLLEPPPAAYPYPRRGYMAFHVLHLDAPGPATTPAPGSESTEAAWFTPEEVRSHCAGAAWLPLHTAALTKPETPVR